MLVTKISINAAEEVSRIVMACYPCERSVGLPTRGGHLRVRSAFEGSRSADLWFGFFHGS